jgi:hypothetical protein
MPKKEFNEKAKTFLYSVSVRPPYSRRKDFTEDMQAMAKRIRELAEEEGCSAKVRISFDDGSLNMNKLGIFFMNAPEKFAAKVKKLDGVQYVEKPSDRKAVPGSKRHGRRIR